jgi:2-polyprenyl-3-methyl-5-hydroxy-6-metoxy-1,4-benzoquinol methylase
VTPNVQIASPVTHSSNVALETELTSKIIIDAYNKEYGIDINEYFQDATTIKIYKCLDSNYRFYYPFTLAGKSDLYEALQKYDWYYGLRKEHQVAETFIESSFNVLEIGCGSGFFLQKLQSKNIKCTGLEFNLEAIKTGREQGLNILKQDVCEHSNDEHEKYDIVCAFQVLEHICQVGDFIQAALDCLKPGGKLIVGVPNSNPYLYKYDKYFTLNLPPHHMGLWDKQTLINMQKVFNVKLNYISIESLDGWEYDHYYKLAVQDFKAKSKLLGVIVEALLVNFKPSKVRIKIQKLVGNFIQGRNVLAVYTKL